MTPVTITCGPQTVSTQTAGKTKYIVCNRVVCLVESTVSQTSSNMFTIPEWSDKHQAVLTPNPTTTYSWCLVVAAFSYDSAAGDTLYARRKMATGASWTCLTQMQPFIKTWISIILSLICLQRRLATMFHAKRGAHHAGARAGTHAQATNVVLPA
jgi:hypothetical protein